MNMPCAADLSQEELTVLGSVPQREERLVRSGPRRTRWYERGDWLTTWPTTFPTASKVATSEEEKTCPGSFHDVYKPLLDALSTLPHLRTLSFAHRVSRSKPGLNQVKQSSLDSFPKRHLGKPSAAHKRWSDGYVMFAMLSALGPQNRIERFVFNDCLSRVYNDLQDAEDDFNLVKSDAILEMDEQKLVGDFPVLVNSFLAELRYRGQNKDSGLRVRYMQQNGQQGEVHVVFQ